MHGGCRVQQVALTVFRCLGWVALVAASMLVFVTGSDVGVRGVSANLVVVSDSGGASGSDTEWVLLAVQSEQLALADFTTGAFSTPLQTVSSKLHRSPKHLFNLDGRAASHEALNASAEDAWVAAALLGGLDIDVKQQRIVVSSDAAGVFVGDEVVDVVDVAGGGVVVSVLRGAETFDVALDADDDVLVSLRDVEVGGSTRPAVLLPAAVDGRSAGLVLALALFDSLEPGFADGLRVGATGGMCGDGAVVPIDGVALKVEAAVSHGVDVLLVPDQNFAEAFAAAAGTDLRVVGVSSLADAVDVLGLLERTI